MRAGVRALDQIVSGLAGKPIHTEPRRLSAGEERAPAKPQVASRSKVEAPKVERAEAPKVERVAAPKVEKVIEARPEDRIANLRPTDATAPMPSLPDRFGIDRVVLLAGHSEWVFAYWEIDPARLAEITKSPSPRAELRLVDEAGTLVGRTTVDPLQGRQHLRIPELGKRYRAELISIDAATDGMTISRSRWVVSSRTGDQVETRNVETMRPEPVSI